MYLCTVLVPVLKYLLLTKGKGVLGHPHMVVAFLLYYYISVFQARQAVWIRHLRGRGGRGLANCVPSSQIHYNTLLRILAFNP